MTFVPITTVHGGVNGGRRRAMDGTPRGVRTMRQQAKTTIYRLEPVVMLAITVAAPMKWGVR